MTLTADDGALGEVDKICYRIDGGALRTYEGPFTVDEPGEHVVEYFADRRGRERRGHQAARVPRRRHGAGARGRR